jgi:hypothetical protein
MNLSLKTKRITVPIASFIMTRFVLRAGRVASIIRFAEIRRWISEVDEA